MRVAAVAAVAALARRCPRTRTSSAVFAAGPAQCCVEGGRFTCTRGATLGRRLMAGKSLGKPTARLVGRWAGGREPIQFATTSRGLRVRPGTPLRGCGGSSSPSSSPLFSKRLTRVPRRLRGGRVGGGQESAGSGSRPSGEDGLRSVSAEVSSVGPTRGDGVAALLCDSSQPRCKVYCRCARRRGALLERPSEGPGLRREPPKVFRAVQTTAHRGAP